MENQKTVGMCYHCEKETELTNYRGFMLCPECMAKVALKELYVCDGCGELLSAEDNEPREVNWDYYCPDCFDECFTTCENCGEICPVEDCSEVETEGGTHETWCSGCVENEALYCDCCGDLIAESEAVTDDSGTVLCPFCFEEHYTRCEDCGEIVHNDYINWDERREGYYCDTCYNSANEVIRNYSYKPVPHFHNLPGDYVKKHGFLYMGFELESGGLDDEEDAENAAQVILDDYSKNEDVFYCKGDSSIPDYGFELVSHPATLNWHKEFQWHKVFNTMSGDYNLRSHDLGIDGCGLHVHCSRDFMAGWRWLFVDYFVAKYKFQFCQIARRPECHWARFSNPENPGTFKQKYGSSGNRYRAVNFTNSRTIEFRLFRGTLNYNTFIATLEVVDGLVQFVAQLKIHDVLKHKGESWELFTDYLTANKERYQEAITYLQAKEVF